MDKKKILFIATSAYAVFNEKINASHGGSELQISNIAKELAKDKSKEISIFVGNYGQNKIEKRKNVNLIRTVSPKAKSNIIIKAFQAKYYFYKLIITKPDIIFTSSANSTVGIVALYSKLFRKKHIHRIAHIMDTNKEWVNSHGLLGKVYKYGLENASYIVCQTEDQKLNLIKYHGKKGILFRNVFEFNDKKLTKKNGTILWVGRASSFKKPETFIEIAKNNPDRKFVMVCNKQSNKNYYNEIESSASKLNNLEFHEKIPFSKIQSYFNSASLFISTSDNEGFANTFIQAGIGKTPIISLNSNPDDFLNEYNCGYHANGNLEKVNIQINKILNNQSIYDAYSKNIFSYVKSTYDIKENIKIIEKLIDKK